jgi:hypothetical protein
MQLLKRNPLTWLMLITLLWACLGAQTLGLKTASGQIYDLNPASWDATPLQAAPRLGLRASASESVSAPPVGANGGGKVAGAVDDVAVTGRPTPRQSEIDVGVDLPPGARPQVSFKNGQEVPYGTSGSVRPDYCLGNVCSVEVKNYNIATNSNGLINNVSQQAIDRAVNLPTGMTQTVVIDVRGQVLTAAQEDAIIRGIVQKSNGAISPTSISFKR